MPNVSAMITKNKTGKYLVRYSRSNSEPLMGLTFQHLEIQGGVDFRLCITKIASVQKTCGIDPKVLGAVALRGVASASEKPGVEVFMRPAAWARLNSKKSVPFTDVYCPAGMACL
jgi:hypothetical protein